MDLKALYKISYGMYVVSVRMDNAINGQIANAVFQVSAEPPVIAISINKQNLTHKFIQESRFCSVSILSKETPMTFIGQFGFKSGRDFNKFQNIKYTTGVKGVPIVLENSIGYMEVEVINSIDMYTHTVFLGKVINAEIIDNKEPMTYAYYHEVKKGKSPKTAPTYQGNPDAVSEEQKIMQKYVCSVCGYVYEPEKGDPDSGIKPGTPFEQLPDTWVCPVCGAEKAKFEKQES